VLYSFLWSHFTIPCGPILCHSALFLFVITPWCAPCDHTLLFLMVLLFVVALYYSLWSCSLWSHSFTPCGPNIFGHVLLFFVVLFLMVMLYCSLWSRFTIPYGQSLVLLVVTLCYSLWSSSTTLYGCILLLVIALCCSLWTCFTRLYLSFLLVVVIYYSFWLHLVCYFCDKIMDYDGEIIFPIVVPLTVKFCVFFLNFAFNINIMGLVCK
jgi:hypothetical protein